MYPSDVLYVCSSIVCCFSSSLELNFWLHISQEKLAETFAVDSSDFPALVLLLECISSLFGSHRAHIPYGAIWPDVYGKTSGPSSVTMAQWFGFIKYTQL